MESNLVFARYALERWANQDNIDILDRFCNTRIKYEDRRGIFFFAIVEPQVLTRHESRVVMAKLAKIRIARQADFWDENNWRTISTELPSPQAESRARFVAFEDNVLAFEERKPYISQMTFMTAMRALYTTASEEAFRTLHLELLKDTRRVLEWIQDTEQVIRVRFEGIRRPNPIDDPVLEKIKKHIDETKAKNMTYENKETGLNAEVGSLLDSGLRLCEQGYGAFDIEARRGQVTERRTSREFTLKARIRFEDDEDFIEKAWSEKRRVSRRRRPPTEGTSRP